MSDCLSACLSVSAQTRLVQFNREKYTWAALLPDMATVCIVASNMLCILYTHGIVNDFVIWNHPVDVPVHARFNEPK